MFLVLGLIILYLALTNQLISHNAYQLTINIYLAQFTKSILSLTKAIPEYVWAVIFFGIFILIVKLAVTQLSTMFKKERR